MTKKSISQLEKKGIIPPTFPSKRSFTQSETLELQEMVRICGARRFEAAQIKGNTAMIPRGQEIAAESDAIARLLENAKNLWVSQKLMECGYENGTNCSINLSTGEIVDNKI